MGFLSASLSFTRYLPVGDVPESLWREIPERLRKNAFQDIDHTADERSFGWSCFDDWLDTEWKAAPPEKGNYLVWLLRLETRRVPPAVFKKHVEIAIREYKASIKDDEKRFVSKARKKEIKEQVALRLRARMLPIPAVFDVVWDMQSRTVYLGSTNTKVRQLFEDCFQQSFELQLEPQTPFYLAGRMLGEEAVSRLENLEPSDFAG
ncbi:exonuclease RdgC [Desulfovibrio sp. X2]|uniref:recombination-associated protein RdgC n=1 Tax=Desulfovibrio sp. X2 TaxID=941449 RepID=UPI000358809E|nr:recombination-associated protein RdgC [Desulfovibrio sp. X2]EPR37061.1 exonuclease RdgC [Desulfovibrio sp. X2]